jgi:Sec-independent protein secretion pathway component TatC
MLILLACMMVLYEVGIVLAGFFTRAADQGAASESATKAKH